MWGRLCSFFIAALALLTVLSEMTYTRNLMTWVMEQRMGAMTDEMDQMGDKFSPRGMVPFNW